MKIDIRPNFILCAPGAEKLPSPLIRNSVNFYPVSPGLSYAKTSSCEDPEKWEMDWV
jgi:hypothetical protein